VLIWRLPPTGNQSADLARPGQPKSSQGHTARYCLARGHEWSASRSQKVLKSGAAGPAGLAGPIEPQPPNTVRGHLIFELSTASPMHPPKTPPTQLRSQGLRASSATCRTSAECGPIGPTGPWKLAHRRKRATAVHRGDPILSVPHSEPPPSVRTCPAVCPARTAQRPMRTPVCPARHARHAHLTVCPAPPTESSVRPAVCPARHFATRAPCVSQAPPRAPCAPPRAPRGTS